MNKLRDILFTPCGGGREIGANSYLLRIAEHDIVFDAGVHPKKEGLESLPDYSLLRRAPDAVIVSHGHVDHCGAVPHLLSQFPSTRLFATPATICIMDRMLHNSVSVMGTLARERGIEEYPLYLHEDVDYAIRQAQGVAMDQDFAINGNGEIMARFHHAGHVLGSAGVLVRTEGHSLFYTGDICAADQELMAGLSPLDPAIGVDSLVIESTYGANEIADSTDYNEQTQLFATRITRVLERGGSVLVPSFALGRMQEMLNIIARLQDCGQVPRVPVYASGLGRAIYEVYNKFSAGLHPDANLQPLSRFGRVGDVWDRNNVVELLRSPCILVATSGMMVENTPSALIADEMVRDKKHGIFFVGYLDPETLGYTLLHAGPGANIRFALDRLPVTVALEDIAWFHFSAHAPREALRDVIERVHPKNVVFVHGDPQAIDWLHGATDTNCRKFSAAVGQTLTLEA